MLEVEPTSQRGRKATKAVAVSEAFAWWLHHEYAGVELSSAGAYHSPHDSLLAICRPSGCTVVSGVVGVVVGICNRSQMRTSKCSCLIFGVSIGLDPG